MMHYLELFFLFFRIGLFTIGGGMAMIPLVKQELVARNLMSLDAAVDMIAISQMTPGPFAVNAATFVGMSLYAVPGAVVTTLGVCLPSIILVLLIAPHYFKFQASPWVKAALYGVRPVVLALIATATIDVFIESVMGVDSSPLFGLDLPVLGIAVVSFLLMRLTKIPIVALIAGAGVIGVIFL